MTDLEITKRCAEIMGYTDGIYIDGLDMMFRTGKLYDPLNDDAQMAALIKRFGLSCGLMDNNKSWYAARNVHKRTYSDTLNRAVCECVATPESEKR